MKKLLFIFAILAWLPIAHASDADAKADRGWEAYNNGDYKTALSIFKPLAEQGHAAGQNTLGWMYYRGLGVKQSNSKAAKLFRKSAEQGNHWGQYNLGNMYFWGNIGGRENYKKAAKWYSLSVEQGNEWAQNDLGWMYGEGRGVKKNYEKSVELLRKSAAQGNRWAQLHLGNMYSYGRGVEKSFIQAYMWADISLEDNNDRDNIRRLNLLLKRIKKNMTPEDIEEAQSKAHQCVASNYEDCGE